MSYSTAQLARAAGVSYRQVDYWTRIGLVTPSINEGIGHGSRRQWSADDLERVRRVAVASRIQSGRLVDALDAIDTLISS